MKDYYHYINNNWLNITQIPDDQVKWSEFNILQESNNIKIIDIISNSNNINIKKLYNSAIKYFNHEYTPNNNIILDILNNIDKINDLQNYFIYLSKLSFFDISVLYDIDIDEDIKYSNKYMVYINQASLGLPDKDYYINKRYSNIRKDYKIFINKLFNFVYKDDKNYADIIFKLEYDISKFELDKTELRDIENRDNRYELDILNDTFNNLFIKDSINEIISMSNNIININQFKYINIDTKLDDHKKSYLFKLNSYIKNIDLEKLKLLLKYNILLSYSSFMNKELYNLNFDFFSNKLRGQKKMKSNDKKAMAIVCGIYGDLITIDYANKYYNSKIDNYMNNMINIVKKIFTNRINKLDWMSNDTKLNAIKKLNHINTKIGFDKKVRDYTKLYMTDDILNNIFLINIYEAMDTYNKLNKSIDKEKWNMDGYIVNAYYSPTNNEIAFPAGILQPPFLNINDHEEVNWGKIGVIIGHEIIHGFDDQGSLFDYQGNMKTWWTKNDIKKYKSKVKQVIKLYDDNGVNGKLTAGENIADIGGVNLAIECLKFIKQRDLNKHELHRFFKAFAEIWRCKMTDEILKERLLTDPHSPPWHRVNICLKNIDEFYETYDINENDSNLSILKENRVNIW